MKVLVTNDDGVLAQGLWVLVKELSRVSTVSVVAPDREQSAIGTAVTLRRPLSVKKVEPQIPGIETYAVSGTPGDSTILAINKLVANRVDVVVSGINHGLNLGDDVLISGTVSGALQAYLRDFPSIAISIESGEREFQETAGRLAALLVKGIDDQRLPNNLFLNVNLPSIPLEKIKGVRATRLSHKTHINAVTEHGEQPEHYVLIRQQLKKEQDKETDIWAVEHDYISLTPLYINISSRPSPISEKFCTELFRELKTKQ